MIVQVWDLHQLNGSLARPRLGERHWEAAAEGSERWVCRK